MADHYPLDLLDERARETIKDATPTVVKDTLASLIATVDIGPGRQASPLFFVPQTNTSPTSRRRRRRRWGRRLAWTHIRWS